MKKRILIISLVLVTLSLAAFSFINPDTTPKPKDGLSSHLLDIEIPNIKNETKEPIEFFYFVGSRFDAIKKSDVNQAKSIHDFISDEDSKQIASIYSTELILIINDRQSEFREYGTDENLTKNQLKLLQSVDYSKHFLIKTNYQNSASDYDDFGPHYTIVPEKQATYTNGKDALLKYLKDNKSKDTDFIDKKKLQFVKVTFTITDNGNLTDVKLDRSSGYPQIDLELVELIKNIPGLWEPAENENGEKIEQELVFSFGLADGC